VVFRPSGVEEDPDGGGGGPLVYRLFYNGTLNITATNFTTSASQCVGWDGTPSGDRYGDYLPAGTYHVEFHGRCDNDTGKSSYIVITKGTTIIDANRSTRHYFSGVGVNTEAMYYGGLVAVNGNEAIYGRMRTGTGGGTCSTSYTHIVATRVSDRSADLA